MSPAEMQEAKQRSMQLRGIQSYIQTHQWVSPDVLMLQQMVKAGVPLESGMKNLQVMNTPYGYVLRYTLETATPTTTPPSTLTSKEEASWIDAYNAVKKTPSSEQTPWVGGVTTAQTIQRSFINWEQPASSGIPLAALATRPYSEPKPQPNVLTQAAQQFSNRLMTPAPVTDPEYWSLDPISSKYGINPGLKRDVNYAWTAKDVYDVASTALLVAGATQVIGSKVISSIRGSSVDVWLAKNWSLYYQKTGGIARGEVSIPSFPSYGMKELAAEDWAFEFANAPRTGGVWLSKAPSGASQVGGESFKYLMRGTIGGWVVKEATFTPFVSQSQVTRLGLQPYTPRPTVASGLTSNMIGRLGVTTEIISQFVGFGKRTTLTPPQPSQPSTPTLTSPPTSTEKPTTTPQTPQSPTQIILPTMGVRPYREISETPIIPKVAFRPYKGEISTPPAPMFRPYRSEKTERSPLTPQITTPTITKPRPFREEPMIQQWTPTYDWEKQIFHPDAAFRQKDRQKLIPVITPITEQVTKQKQQQAPIQTPQQVQKPRQILAFPTPLTPRTRTTQGWPSYRLPENRRFRSSGSRLLGSQWFFKRHPIPTPRFVVERMILKGRRRRRR